MIVSAPLCCVMYMAFSCLRYYIFELLKALDYFHANGTMHQNMKPHNVTSTHHHPPFPHPRPRFV